MRTIAIYLLAVVLSGVLPVNAQPGDTNCDGRTDRSDLAALILALFGQSTCPGADVNDDRRVAAADVTALLVLLSLVPPPATATTTATAVATAIPTDAATPLPTQAATPVPTDAATPVPTQAATPVPTPNATAVIAPFSTYLGGDRDDFIRDVAIDAAGNIYLTGGTASADFATTPGSYDRTHNGWMDVFVTKLAPDGSLLWSTLIGGPNYDRAYAIEVDPHGNLIVGGRAGAGFPTTNGTVQPYFAGDGNPNQLYGTQDGFVVALSPDGRALLWSTYFGGPDQSFLRDIAVDARGDVYLAETRVSDPNPHITVGAFQTSPGGGFDGVIAKLTAAGTEVAWATYFGGSGTDFGTPTIRVDHNRDVYVLGGTGSPDTPTTPTAHRRELAGGFDMHVAKLSADGSRLLFGTYIGGNGNDFTETHGLAVDAQGRAIVGFTTRSTDMPTTPHAFQSTYAGSGGNGSGAGTNYNGDGYVAILAADGSSLAAATYLGGHHGDGIEGVSVDPSGRVYVSGATYSTTFPVSSNARQPKNGGDSDFLVAVLSPDLRELIYASYLGGSGGDEGRSSAIDAGGRLVVVGHSTSRDWPVANALQDARRGAEEGVLAIGNAGR